MNKKKRNDYLDDEPVCPDCGELMKIVYENVGYQAPDPEYLQQIGFICPECGYKEDL
jgi:acetone carboxylase gamma subunit